MGRCLLLFGLALAAVGCPAEEEPRRWYSGPCSEEGTCPGGAPCVESLCARPCKGGGECGDGLCFKSYCQPVEKACAAGYCDDGNACTTDLYLLGSGTCLCKNDAREGVCSDGLACTVGDECVKSYCQAAPKTCPPGQVCKEPDGKCQ
jgi:hypothetical protein